MRIVSMILVPVFLFAISQAWSAAGPETTGSSKNAAAQNERTAFRPPPARLSGLELQDHPVPIHGDTGGVAGLGFGLQSAADHIIAQQCPNGGFTWEHIPPSDCTTTYYNITAPIMLGVLDAYPFTNDPSHLIAAGLGGDYELTSVYGNSEARFGAFSPYYLMRLSAASGDAQYSNHAAVGFFDELSAGTYGPADLNTSGWIASVQTARSGSLINLRPWEFHTLIATATSIGNAGQDSEFLQALLSGLETLDNTDAFSVYYDLLGLAGGVRGLALIGTTSFPALNCPNFSAIHGKSTLKDLADVLAGYQNANGSWYWASSIPGPVSSDEDTQTSAYAVLALKAADPLVSSDFSTAVSNGRIWISGMQLAGGGFLTYPGGGENTEVEGEALSALAPEDCTFDVLEFKLGSGSNCVRPGELVTVELHQRGLAQVVRGFQAFAQFDPTAMTFLSGTYTAAPYGLPVITPISAVGSNIDMAAGINNFGGQLPTSADAKLVTLTFAAGASEGPTVVNFRAHEPPTRFSDSVGAEVLPCLIESPTIFVDGTNPSITCPGGLTVACFPSATNPSYTGFATATDNLDPNPAVTYSDSVVGAACPLISVVTRTWRATDCAGNFSTCVQTITVEDTTPPTIQCPPDVIVECDDPTDPSQTGYPSYFQGFEDPGFVAPPIQAGYSDWQAYHSTLLRVPSGTDGVPSKTGVAHGRIDSTSLPAPPDNFSGAFTTLGGYSSTFLGGFTTSVDVYVDLADSAVIGNTYGWDVSSAVNNQSGAHRRDFVFHAASNASGEILIGGSNNTNFTRRTDLASINHYTVTGTGWYTLQWVFRDNGSGVLAVDLNLRDDGGILLWTETRSNPADLIASLIGGNRYMWFPFLEVSRLAIDNTSLTGITKAVDHCDSAATVTHSDDVAPGSCPQGSVITRTWTAEDDCGNEASCVQTITVIDSTSPSLTVPSDATIECDEPIEPALPFGSVAGGIMVRYNTSSEVPANEAYWKFQSSQANSNGAAFTYSSLPLAGDGFNWASFWGQVGSPSQFGFDLVLKIPTATIPIPYPMAYDNADNTIAGRAPAGLVRWMIDHYAPLGGPSGPANPGNSVINSHVRSLTPPSLFPGDDLEILSLNIVNAPPLSTMTLSGVLHSDGIHHWYAPAAPDSPMGDLGLNGDYYFSGTFVYDSTLDVTPNGNFYAGTMEILANSPSSGLGFGTATDNCDPAPVVTYTDVPDLGGCNGTGSITRTWKAVDECGNETELPQVITIVDTTAPVIAECPADVVVYPPAGSCGAQVNFLTPTAIDNCGVPTVTCDPPSGSVFPAGTTLVTCTAEDACGNSDAGSVCAFDVTVHSTNQMDVTVQLSPTMATGPVDRCITFEFRDCPGTTLLATSTHLMEFSGGTTGLVTLEVPCGNYDCATARDRQHTLRRTDEGFGISGTKYVAQFTLSPPEGDWLIGGNLNDDPWIDMLDFGGFSSQFLMHPGDIASCPVSPPLHSDINGDGVVDNMDFTFIRTNFLLGHEANCCGAGSVASHADAPIDRISVRELHRRGLGEYAAGDLNGDGWLDLLDIEAFVSGVRPVPVKISPQASDLKRTTDRETAPR